MLLVLLVIIMKFVNITKLHSQHCSATTGSACNNKLCLQHHQQHVAEARKHLWSNSSSTSSGCDSSTSSSSTKENYFDRMQQKAHEEQEEIGITAQQLQQLRLFQQLQRKQLYLLQQHLIKRRQLQNQQQQQCHMGVSGGARTTNKSKHTLPLNCNQQYLLQLRIQQQQEKQQQQQQELVYVPKYVNNYNDNNINNNINDLFYNELDVLNNNNNNNYNNNINQNVNSVGGVGGFGCNDFDGFSQVQKFGRGMTEFSIKNETKHKSHFSQPLQNSPSHFNPHHNQEQKQPYHQNYNLNKQNNLQIVSQQQQEQALNLNNNITKALNATNKIATTTATLANINCKINTNTTPISPPITAQNSPLHYKKPLNSPNNSPFAHSYARQQQQQQQQLLLHIGNSNNNNNKQTKYQQHLNDILVQQHHLQQQQQQLLRVTPHDLAAERECESELSEESLKQNVAIVLNNLDRYNNALRSIILNEQVTNSAFMESVDCCNNNNNNNSYNHNNNYLHISEELEMATAATPESDYNSNATTPVARCYDGGNMQTAHGGHMVGVLNGGGGSNNALINNCAGFGPNVGIGGNNLNCSLASEHDFTHDNTDYQWFLDYGYRDGCSGMQRSVLSSLNASYNALGEFIYYEDIAKNLDANLAEVDMESFRAEDINSLLWQLPTYCQRLANSNQRLQQSLLMQQQQQQQHFQQQHHMQQQHMQQCTISTNELIDNSICKSELLFSPVKETHLSVDSLDIDNYPDDADLILTCKANKDNYTIAFEGSVLYSDDSYYEPADICIKNKQNFINLHNNLHDLVQHKVLDASMSRSAQVAATFASNKMPKNTNMHLQRCSSGNNNTTEVIILPRPFATHRIVRKSNSLPNLCDTTTTTTTNRTMCSSSTQSSAKTSPQHVPSRRSPLNVPQAKQTKTVRNMLPMCRIPICCDSMLEDNLTPCAQHQVQQQQSQQNHHHHHHRHKQQRCCVNNNQANTLQHQQQNQQQQMSSVSSSSSGSSHTPAYNLVKMYIKQKSSNNSSIESGAAASAHTCMDVSSGCWPSSEAAGSNSSNSSSLEQRLRKKSMHDSGKGSALSKHEEEDADVVVAKNSANKRQMPVMRHPQVSLLAHNHNNNNNSINNNNNNNNINNNKSSIGSSYQSSSASEQMTQLEMAKRRSSTPNSTAQEMITRSMQTSCGGTISARSSFSERLRCIPPSFLAKLNNLGESRQAPIYVIYPNYALPDLGFVQTNTSAEIIYTPFNYKTTMSNLGDTQPTIMKKRVSVSSELFKQMDYKHVEDWQSLVTLLPTEYRQRLKHIPQVTEVLSHMQLEPQRPLFCLTPTIKRSRQHVCDCAQYNMEACQTPSNEACGSSSSGSSQQPSSGYRGSSTLLTDSELDNVSSTPLKQMYVYQYEQQQVKPRGILRQHSANKRNSMIECGQQNHKLSKLEKRRSLQEPAYAAAPYAVGSSEELEEVFEEEETMVTPTSSGKQRLSRRDLDARARAENFLSSVPRAELKYYAEIAAILESTEAQNPAVTYDAAALKKQVSNLLSQQKKVSFNDDTDNRAQPTVFNAETQKRFSTPPNSPNISMAGMHAVKRYSSAIKPSTLDARQQLKLENNRFKRLQIQWELMSKDSSMLKELAAEHQTKSGGSTPTTAPNTHKSRIPRPVSYPAGKISAQDAKGVVSQARSPSRIVPPKRYSNTTPTSATQTTPTSSTTPMSGQRARTPTSRTPVTAPNTPKRQMPTPRLTARPR